MKPLFTIHAGEFVAGDYIEHTFRRVNVWVPAKDTGVDLLVSDMENRKTVSLQVKFSRDFLATHMAAIFQKPLRACGWWSLNRQKIASSSANYWIFVLVGFARRSTDFVIIKPTELLRSLDAIHGKRRIVQSYLWVTEKRRCWEARSLTVLAAPGNHDIPADLSHGEFARSAGAYLTFLAQKAPEIKTRDGRKLADGLDKLKTLDVTPDGLKELQRKADEDWYVFAARNWRGKPLGSPPVLSLESVMHSRQERFWESRYETAFPLFWIDANSQTAVIIVNSTSGQRDAGRAFGDIDDDQLRATANLLNDGLPASLNTIFILDHHPPTGRSDEILGSGPDRWWFPWAWQGTEIYEYGTLGKQTTSGQKLLAVLEKAVERRRNTEFAVISGHRHSLWIGKYGPIWILDPPSLAKEYSDPDRPFPAANRIIAGWHEDDRLRIALLPRSGIR